MPSVSSSSRPKVLLSSTVMTPSLPTLSIASAMSSPTVVSAAEIEAVAAICSLVSTGLATLSRCSVTAATAASMPRLRLIGLAPAATLRRPSRTRAWASTLAVVVPSPATSSVFLATSLTSSAPIFSYGSSSSISLAMDTPSLVMVGAPHFFSRTTLRPRGPNVTLTASARMFIPRSSPRRASSLKAISLAMRCRSSRSADPRRHRGGKKSVSNWRLSGLDDARDGRTWRRPAGRPGDDESTHRFDLALGYPECQFHTGTLGWRVQARRPLRLSPAGRQPDRYHRGSAGPGPRPAPAGRGHPVPYRSMPGRRDHRDRAQLPELAVLRGRRPHGRSARVSGARGGAGHPGRLERHPDGREQRRTAGLALGRVGGHPPSHDVVDGRGQCGQRGQGRHRTGQVPGDDSAHVAEVGRPS